MKWDFDMVKKVGKIIFDDIWYFFFYRGEVF